MKPVEGKQKIVCYESQWLGMMLIPEECRELILLGFWHITDIREEEKWSDESYAE
jgi:hypothetical protein